jgi:hypothetical protein
MSSDLRKMRKEERLRAKELRKDRLIQTRVDRRLQKVLIEEARRRRISVSNLVRNVLEDAFGLADPDVGPALDAATLPPQPDLDLESYYAWTPVVLGKSSRCSRCARDLDPGKQALMGLSDDPSAERVWLCVECGQDL